MKILVFADLHVGVKTYGKLDPISGLNTREIQTLNILDEMITYAIDNNIEMIIAAGDMYKNSMPTPTLQNEFNKRLKRASDAGIITLLLDGNHDVSKMENMASPLKSFDTFNIPNIIHTRFHKEYNYKDIKFVFLPTHHTKEQIEDIIKNTDYTNPVIFIGHMTIRGAMLNDWLLEQKETYIEVEAFKRPNILAVALGHLHKHQVLCAEPLIFYTGSAQRIDFNEENQSKGFVVLNINDNIIDYEFIEVESQKFLTIKLDLIGVDNPTDFIIAELNKKKESIKDAIVRVKVDIDEAVKINERQVYEHIYLLNASNVLDIQKSFERQKIIKNAELTEYVSIEKGLEIYYKDKVRSKERIELGKKIIKKLEE